MSFESPATAPYPLIDIGINLTNSQFQQDAMEVVDRAICAGVTTMILTGTCIESTEASILLAENHSALWCTAGVHPHDASSCDSNALSAIARLAKHPKVKAIGECGLDFNRNYSPPDAQQQAFEAQLELAADLQLPVFVHERDAGEAVAETLGRWRNKIPAAVVHCFTGSRESLHRYLDLDLHIGITGWICDEKRGGHLRELVGDIPAGRLMIETDAPFLIPRDLPGKPKERRNEPRWLPHIAAALAHYRGESLAALCEHTSRTAVAFFRLPEND